MLEVLASRAQSVRPDRSQGQRLRLVPILGPSSDVPPYELLRPQTVPHVKITEISEGGSVPTLHVTNELDIRVFLMDGQELIGAKQNRILNADVLVPASGSITIPVSCVEQGRWHHKTQAFTSGKSASHRIRASKMSRVHQSLKERREHDADQGAVWNEVQESMRVSDTTSQTMALSDAYAQREAELQDFRKTMRLPSDAVGLAAFSDGRFQGLDLFDRHSTMKYFWESLLDSYALELIATEGENPIAANPAEEKIVTEVLEKAARADWEPFHSPGEGRDWRVGSADLSGSALVYDDRVIVHLQLFPGNPSFADQRTEQATSRRPRIRRDYLK